MYKISTFVMLTALMSIIGFGAAGSYGKEPVTSVGVHPFQISQLYGSYVKNPQGEYLGRIEDFIVENGRISYLVMVQGGFVGIGGKLIAVPFEACSFDPKGPGFLLNVSREKLRSAHTFFRSTDLSGRKWAEDSYRFFGLQPYWTDEGHGKAGQSAIHEEMKPEEQEKAKETTKPDESKRLFYEYEPLWPLL
jgi:sporulation protein YlmC with PRC-barrel domain